MTLAEQAARKRKNLEDRYYLSHDEKFENRVRKETYNTLLLVAVLTAIVYALSIHVYYKNNTPAKPGKIYAKSEMTKAEISKLNLGK